MQEKHGLDQLVENLKKLGLSPEYSEMNKGTIISQRNRYAKAYTVSAELSDSIYFIARSNVSASFTGIYSIIDLPAEVEYKVYKRNWFDPLMLRKGLKVGIKYIDNNLSIFATKWKPSKELSLENVNLFLGINKTKAYRLIVENNYLYTIFEPLKDRKLIGLETSEWLYRYEDLESLLKTGEELVSNMKNASNNKH